MGFLLFLYMANNRFEPTGSNLDKITPLSDKERMDRSLQATGEFVPPFPGYGGDTKENKKYGII
jgi:hypothetical protein